MVYETCCKQLSRRPGLQGASPRDHRQVSSDCIPPQGHEAGLRKQSFGDDGAEPSHLNTLTRKVRTRWETVILCHEHEVLQIANSSWENLRDNNAVGFPSQSITGRPCVTPEERAEKCTGRKPPRHGAGRWEQQGEAVVSIRLVLPPRVSAILMFWLLKALGVLVGETPPPPAGLPVLRRSLPLLP